MSTGSLAGRSRWLARGIVVVLCGLAGSAMVLALDSVASDLDSATFNTAAAVTTTVWLSVPTVPPELEAALGDSAKFVLPPMDAQFRSLKSEEFAARVTEVGFNDVAFHASFDPIQTLFVISATAGTEQESDVAASAIVELYRDDIRTWVAANLQLRLDFLVQLPSVDGEAGARLDAQRTVLLSAVQHIDTLGVAVEIGRTSVVEPPGLAALDRSPLVLSLLGFVTGALAAVAGLFGWRLLDRRIRSADDLRYVLDGIPCAGIDGNAPDRSDVALILSGIESETPVLLVPIGRVTESSESVASAIVRDAAVAASWDGQIEVVPLPDGAARVRTSDAAVILFVLAHRAKEADVARIADQIRRMNVEVAGAIVILNSKSN